VRIAQIATCSGPVLPSGTGSIESLVWLLCRELTRRGHEVTVFACAGSRVDGKLVVTQPGPYGTPGTPSDWQVCDWMTLCEAVRQSDRFDIVHSHAYLWGLPLERFSRAPMVHTLHTMPYDDEALLWDRYPGARIVAVSKSQWASASSKSPYAVVHHGIDADQFTFRANPAAYVLYLGRFTPGKGPLQAIAAARQAETPLVLAGPRNDYFDCHIAPLVDGDRVQYAGEADAAMRNRLLGEARALLYPLQEPEPFGLVQVEAMFCGTPVVALNVGAVPEVVDQGTTGLVVNAERELIEAITSAVTLDRSVVRRRAVARFSSAQMAEAHERTYLRAVSHERAHDTRPAGA
jgi:glycosyltransferase involved in cell wall biosynthesis